MHESICSDLYTFKKIVRHSPSLNTHLNTFELQNDNVMAEKSTNCAPLLDQNQSVFLSHI